MSERISLDEVRRIANLARLGIRDEEASAMRSQLDSILDYMATLEKLDVSEVEPTYHAIEMVAALREDVPGRTLAREEVLRMAPRSEAGGFAVPKVMEGE